MTTFVLEQVMLIVQQVFLFAIFILLDLIIVKEPLQQMGLDQPF